MFFNKQFIVAITLIGIALTSSGLSAASDARRLTLERIFSSPDLDGASLRGLQFAGDSDRITFLKAKPDRIDRLDLFEFDSGRNSFQLLIDSDRFKDLPLSEIEKARRERLRISHGGITSYAWSRDGQLMVFPMNNQVYLYNRKTDQIKQITDHQLPSLHPNFSSKGKFLTYTRGSDLLIYSLSSQTERVVVASESEEVFYGRAEFIAQEEMGRQEGYWWSPDERYLAFTEVDEGPVKVVERVEIDARRTIIRKQKYPEVGTDNARVRIGLKRIPTYEEPAEKSSEIQWVPIKSYSDYYVARVAWTPDGLLAYQIQSRDQKKLDLYFYDPVLNRARKILTEKSSTWVSLNDDLFFLKNSQFVIWASDKKGFKHLYLFNRQGRTVRQLTSGNWEVKKIEAVNEQTNFLYFTASIESPLEKHLYKLKIDDPKQITKITRLNGWNEVKANASQKTFLLGHSSPEQPIQWSLLDHDGNLLSWIEKNELNESHPLFLFKQDFIEPVIESFRGPSGDLIYYWFYLPKNTKSPGGHPLIVHGYGGPGVQLVNRSWQGRRGYLAQIMAQQGFAVAIFDNRGSKGRGKKFEEAIYKKMGVVEVQDQIAGVKHLLKKKIIDPGRIGFWGWSYGGYLSLHLAAKSEGLYRANVAVAPVTDFQLYDTHYTERFLGLPLANPKVYQVANVLNYTKNMKNDLLVIHGMADDNVLFANSTILFHQLQQEGKLFESLTYPGAKHGISGLANQFHVHSSIMDFFNRRLKAR